MTIRAVERFAERRVLLAVWSIAAFQGLLLFALGVDRYVAHRAQVDLGLFTQALGSGRVLLSNTFEGGSHWSIHFSPILLVCAPLVRLTHSALALTALQSIACALALPPLYLIARRRTSARRALGIVALAAAYPPLLGVAFSDFHENGFVPAATLWLLWALDSRRFVLAYALLVVTVGIKEDQAAILGFLGACAIVARRRDPALVRFGMVAIGLASAVLAGYFGWLRPLAGPAAGWQPTRFYAWSPADIHTILLPTLGDRLGYVLLALVPLAFLPLGSPALVLALPGFAECLLSREHPTYVMGQHYAATWIPYALLAFALTAARLETTRLMRVAVALTSLVFVFANPLHPGYFLRVPGERDARLDRFLANLPPDVAIGTQEEAYTHLGFDRNAQIGMQNEPPYVLIDRDYPDSVSGQQLAGALTGPVAHGRYRRLWSEGGIELYVREDLRQRSGDLFRGVSVTTRDRERPGGSGPR